MRKNHLLYLAIILFAGLASARFVSTGRAQTPQSAVEVSNPPSSAAGTTPITLQGTTPLTKLVTEALREEQRQQIIHYFLSQIAATPARRDALWWARNRLDSSSLETHRAHLRKMLGIPDFHLRNSQVKIASENQGLRVEDVTLPTDSGLSARALVFFPFATMLQGGVIAIPPAKKSREEFAGVMEGSNPAPWLKLLLAHNLAVAVPITIERSDDHPICKQAGGKDRRRVLWRAGFIVGRTMVGLEVQQALALRQYLASRQEIGTKPIAVMGMEQGGMTALYAAALDPHFTAAASLDYFQQRENCWQEPVDRVINGQLNEFGDAEVAALIAPRPLLIATAPESAISLASVNAECARARRFYDALESENRLVELTPQQGTLEATAQRLATELNATENSNPPNITLQVPYAQIEEARDQQFESWFQYLQSLIASSSQTRKQYWQLNSTPAAGREKKAEQLRAELARLVGAIPTGKTPINARTRLTAETDKFRAYDVFLDVVPGVEAYGQLLVPRPAGGLEHQRLPAVVCQHGFDGAPKYVSGVGDDLESNDHFYHRFGQRLAERGYVVFAPYLTVPEVKHTEVIVHRADLVNTQVRLAAAIGLMRTSIELAKLHRIVDFLQSLPFVDSAHLGYYGLSYGGYSAIWMPPLEPRLKLTIISAHFNDWQTMLTDSTRQGDSYWSLPDEDFYNWNVLNRFVHTELIAAMWPRPVCVEYGSQDQVTTKEWHQRAWNDVHTFAEAWGMQDKIVDEDFAGPHSIHGVGTFFFLDRWLRPNRPAGRDFGCKDDDYCYQNLAPGNHGYDLSTNPAAPYITKQVDSSPETIIRGRFYVTAGTPIFTGMAFKLARTGNPGNMVVRFGSKEGGSDLGEAEILSQSVDPQNQQWQEAKLKSPVRLDPQRLYYFELRATSGHAPADDYVVFGPRPLGGDDYPNAFGLSFRTLTHQ